MSTIIENTEDFEDTENIDSNGDNAVEEDDYTVHDKDHYYKSRYHGPAENAYVELFWKNRAKYPIITELIFAGLDEHGNDEFDNGEQLPVDDTVLDDSY